MANGRDRDPGDLFCAAPEELQCNPRPEPPRGRGPTEEDINELVLEANHGHDHDVRGDAGYAYAHSESEGTTFGAGLRSEGENVDVDGPHVNFGVGNYRNRDGEEEFGGHLEAGVLGGTLHPSDPDNPSQAEEHFATIEGGLWDDGNTFNIGASADLLGVSGEVVLDQGSGDHQMHADRDDDTIIGANLGVGMGSGFRFHHGDEDGDGVREIGLGFSAGPGGVDGRSEYLGQAWNRVTEWWND